VNKIKKDSDISEIAAIVSEALEQAGVSAVLSGGAVVSIYTRNAYISQDLDFVSSASFDQIKKSLSGIGFTEGQGRYFTHEDTEFFLEFPSGPLSVGDEIVREWSQLETESGVIQILTPTQCVMDRLAAFYHWTDRQSLDQAVAVAKSQDVDLDVIKDWSQREGSSEKYERFLSLMSKP